MPFHLGDALLFGQKVLLYDSKKGGGIAPPWCPQATQAESARARVLLEQMLNGRKLKDQALGKETT